mmetsp:Transcript_1907/g.3771  ORF Transcript_1907/g.3771 Transcript_1907/m.3771 type:complete len:109 (-) Transcript_1907:1237-1563(-)
MVMATIVTTVTIMAVITVVVAMAVVMMAVAMVAVAMVAAVSIMIVAAMMIAMMTVSAFMVPVMAAVATTQLSQPPVLLKDGWKGNNYECIVFKMVTYKYEREVVSNIY